MFSDICNVHKPHSNDFKATFIKCEVYVLIFKREDLTVLNIPPLNTRHEIDILQAPEINNS
jgi:hypothetical protein